MPERVSEETKNRILSAAAARLREEPMRSLQTRDIAADAGVSPSALYKAYSNKYELFLFAAERVLAEQMAAIVDQIDESARPIEIVESSTVGICEVVTKHPYAVGYAFIGLPFLHRDDVGEDAYESLVAMRRDIRDRLASRLRAAIEAGEIDGDPEEVVEFYMTLLFGYLGTALNGMTSESPQRFARRMIACLQVLADEPPAAAS